MNLMQNLLDAQRTVKTWQKYREEAVERFANGDPTGSVYISMTGMLQRIIKQNCLEHHCTPVEYLVALSNTDIKERDLIPMLAAGYELCNGNDYTITEKTTT